EDFLEGKPVSGWSAESLPAGSDEKHCPIAFNALPQIDVFSEAGYTYEERRKMKETRDARAYTGFLIFL
ncbi:Asd/ArgC dimerization domain-containing protein, partial [Enterococcus faecalis]|nr:Asd/ArgC dimerization domain-containing protein [Enterococcus faecalis]